MPTGAWDWSGIIEKDADERQQNQLLSLQMSQQMQEAPQKRLKAKLENIDLMRKVNPDAALKMWNSDEEITSKVGRISSLGTEGKYEIVQNHKTGDMFLFNNKTGEKPTKLDLESDSPGPSPNDPDKPDIVKSEIDGKTVYFQKKKGDYGKTEFTRLEPKQETRFDFDKDAAITSWKKKNPDKGEPDKDQIQAELQTIERKSRELTPTEEKQQIRIAGAKAGATAEARQEVKSEGSGKGSSGGLARVGANNQVDKIVDQKFTGVLSEEDRAKIDADPKHDPRPYLNEKNQKLYDRIKIDAQNNATSMNPAEAVDTALRKNAPAKKIAPLPGAPAQPGTPAAPTGATPGATPPPPPPRGKPLNNVSVQYFLKQAGWDGMSKPTPAQTTEAKRLAAQQGFAVGQ